MRAFLVFTLLVVSAASLALGQDTNFSSGPQYLQNGSPMFARSLATPSISLSQPPYEMKAADQWETPAYEQATAPTQPAAPPDLFSIYYGGSNGSVAEANSGAASTESSATVMPTDFLDTGVSRLTTVQSLQERGYGISVGGLAVYERAHAKRATRVYTNADINRLSGN